MKGLPKHKLDIIIGDLSKSKPDGMSEDMPEEEAEVSEEQVAMADELMSAIESKDSKAVAHALHAFYELCMDHESGESPEKEKSESEGY